MMDAEVLDKYRKAGAILKQVRENAIPMVKKGARLLDVANAIEADIVAKGGKPAFPVNISLNDEAAHDTPGIGDEREFGDDMVKLDIGVHVDGYIADTAVTVDLSGNPDLVKASRKALEEAIKLVRPGVNTGQIGATIEETIEGFGLKPVYNLTGHGLERYVQHAEPAIPNKRIGQGIILEAGQVIAIEPFATNGIGIVVEGPVVEIFSTIKVKPVRMPSEREALKAIEQYNGLPFARRWLGDVKYIDRSLASLMRQGIIHGYPVLVEHEHGLVSQAEHTMIVTEDGCELTT
ncbi:methionine aminopeptidase, type II [Methanocella conradii HZ254]|uniref:Methionine aminopeptidase n=1 Tax=Methanocella conradii (strain DSM 24694 / JCM 17849 / CGMCC 1.5162 / HZ254) TaxID=1041930 RepID=H8I820_METCZ|nr:type II methionyl aminopeptidase [Methanocella conradii]AFD00838.1 methionine aminopeptidase, type II [Methanocella conradii HZ254]